ncbi:MAG: four helix bundle protein [Oligoflexales bacterium]
MKTFRTYELAVDLYNRAKSVKLPSFLRSQLLRAASSVALNLAEGNARKGQADRRKFFNISLASLREVQSIMRLEPKACRDLIQVADKLGGNLYCLQRSLL